MMEDVTLGKGKHFLKKLRYNFFFQDVTTIIFFFPSLSILFSPPGSWFQRELFSSQTTPTPFYLHAQFLQPCFFIEYVIFSYLSLSVSLCLERSKASEVKKQSSNPFSTLPAHPHLFYSTLIFHFSFRKQR